MVSAVKTPDAGRRDAIRIGWWYGLALVAFVLALLGKTSTVMLPVVLIACAAWQRRRITRQDWLQTGPFFFLALAFGLMSIWFQKHQALAAAGQTLSPESLWQRIAIAGHVICFYLGKALLPIYLNIVYPPLEIGWESGGVGSAGFIFGRRFGSVLALPSHLGTRCTVWVGLFYPDLVPSTRLF